MIDQHIKGILNIEKINIYIDYFLKKILCVI